MQVERWRDSEADPLWKRIRQRFWDGRAVRGVAFLAQARVLTTKQIAESYSRVDTSRWSGRVSAPRFGSAWPERESCVCQLKHLTLKRRFVPAWVLTDADFVLAERLQKRLPLPCGRQRPRVPTGWSCVAQSVIGAPISSIAQGDLSLRP